MFSSEKFFLIFKHIFLDFFFDVFILGNILKDFFSKIFVNDVKFVSRENI